MFGCVLKSNKYLQILSLARTDYLGINCNCVLFVCMCVFVWELKGYKKGSVKIYVYSKKALHLRTRSVCRISLWFKSCFVVVYTFVSGVSFELVSAFCQTKAVDKISQ